MEAAPRRRGNGGYFQRRVGNPQAVSCARRARFHYRRRAAQLWSRNHFRNVLQRSRAALALYDFRSSARCESGIQQRSRTALGSEPPISHRVWSGWDAAALALFRNRLFGQLAKDREFEMIVLADLHHHEDPGAEDDQFE